MLALPLYGNTVGGTSMADTQKLRVLISPETKLAVSSTVTDYQRLCPVEYGLFCDEQKVRRDKQATATGALVTERKTHRAIGGSVVERLVMEIPETLDGMIKLRLTDEQWTEFTSKSGARWFARSFPHFRPIDKV